jgi:hypothetical protein
MNTTYGIEVSQIIVMKYEMSDYKPSSMLECRDEIACLSLKKDNPVQIIA